MNEIALQYRCLQVVASCKTRWHLAGAKRFLELAQKHRKLNIKIYTQFIEQIVLLDTVLRLGQPIDAVNAIRKIEEFGK